MFKLSKYIAKYKSSVITGPILKFLEAITDIITPILVSVILDFAIPNNNTSLIIIISVSGIVINLLGFACAVVCQRCSALASEGVAKDIRNDLYSHILSLSSAETDRYTTMSLTNRLVHDVDQISTAIAMTIRLVSRAPFLLIGSTVAAMIIDIPLSLVFIVLMPIILLVVFVIMKALSKWFNISKKDLDNVSNVTRETLSGNRVVRAFNKQLDTINKFCVVNNKLTSTNTKIGNISAITQPLLYAIINIAIVCIIAFGAFRVDTGAISTGNIIAFINYFGLISTALIIIARLIIVYTRTSASTKRIDEIFKLSSKVKDTSSPLPLNMQDEAEILFKNVSFSYSNYKNMVNNLTLNIPSGSTVGIIGGTGSGKSSLVNLLVRFYDVTSGEILINGINIKKYALKDLRKYVSIVPQNPTLFKGTICSNLRWRDPEATQEDMIKALKIAQAYEFVCEYDDGLNHKVERGGVNFSGGQKQRLTIARALIGHPKVLILDDSSSALDFSTDFNLRKTIRTMLKNTTTFIVSQRTNSIKNADIIIVMDNGNISGIGTHDELLKNNEIYAEIHYSQNKKEAGLWVTKILL